MKQYLIDELRYEDFEQIKNYMDEHLEASGMENLYWLPIEPELLSPMQAEHKDCHPLYFAVELRENSISCELLVRTRWRMKCDCIAYADRQQRSWLMDSLDAILEKLKISI